MEPGKARLDEAGTSLVRVRNPVSFTGREDVNVRFSLPVQRATGGLITLTFLNAPVLFVANLKAREVGLRLPNLPLSIVVTALVGITMQLVVLMLNLAAFALFERTISQLPICRWEHCIGCWA